MVAVLTVLLIDCIAGIALFSFIQPVTRSRYEELASLPIDAEKIVQEGETSE